jgi:hypothetical protein
MTGRQWGVRLLDVRHGVETEGLPERQAMERLLRMRGIHPRLDPASSSMHRRPTRLPTGPGLLILMVAALIAGVMLRGGVLLLSLLLTAYLVARFVRWTR